MGRGLATGAACVGVAAAILAGCTFILPFDDYVPAKDASTDRGAPKADTGAPAEEEDAAPPPEEKDSGGGGTLPEPDCDPTFTGTVSCTGIERANCASSTSTFATYPRDRGSDLVVCKDGVFVCVKKCATGCAVMPTGYADVCDQCAGKSDGYHCGQNVTDATRASELDMECSGGKTVKGHVCGANRCQSPCAGGGVQPDCCI